MATIKVMVLARTALQYFVFIHKTDLPASGFVWAREPRMLEGLDRNTQKVVKLKDCYLVTNRAVIDLYEMIIGERGFKTYTAESFIEELATNE